MEEILEATNNGDHRNSGTLSVARFPPSMVPPKGPTYPLEEARQS